MALNGFTQVLKHSGLSVRPFFTSKLKLASISETRLPSVPNTLKIAYTPGIAGNYVERDNILVTRNTRRIKVEHKLHNRANDRLYWSFVVETSRSHIPLAVARNKFKRRWNNAFAKALKDSGLDYHGRVQPALDGKPFVVALRGTLEVKVFNAAHWEDGNQSRMVQHSVNIIKGLQQRQKPQEERDEESVIRYEFRDPKRGDVKYGS